MFQFTFILVLLGVFCEQPFSDYRKIYNQYKKEDKVVVLDKNNFKEVQKSVDRILVEFYAPWCKHCQQLAPKYSRISSTLQTQEKNILIAKINADEEKEIAKEYQIKGYPTLILFNGGQTEKYEGPLEEKQILNWINRKLNRKARQIYTLEEYHKMQKKKMAVLYVFPEGEIQSHRRLQQVAQYYDKIPVFYTHTKDIKKQIDCHENYCFYVHRNFDDGQKSIKNQDPLQVFSMIQFLDTLRYPNVEELNEEVLQRYIHRSQSAMVYFGDNLKSESYQVFTQFAKENKNKIKFAVNSFQNELSDILAKFADVKDNELPTVRILKLSPSNIEKYKIDEITSQNLQDSLDKFTDNKLDAIYKSEEIPQKNDGLIKVLVGNNFDQIIGKDKYIFLDIYAPECEECMQLQDIYQNLAQEYQQNSNVQFYKIDVSKNEHPKLKIQGLPTFRLYKPNKTTHKEYDGPRTYDEIKAFIEIELNEPDIETDI